MCLHWFHPLINLYQSYLHSKFEHPNPLGKVFRRALRFNKICYDRSDLHNNCKRLLNTLTKTSTVLLQFQETSYYTKLKHPTLNVCHLLSHFTGLYLASKQKLTKTGIFYKLNQNWKNFLLNFQFWHSKETETLET